MANRREFLKATSGTALGLGLAPAAAPAQTTQAGQTAKTIGLQLGAVSFVDEGVERVLDTIQERAHVNTLFLATFTYGRGIAGRQVPGQPLPDHGKQVYDSDFHGGSYTEIHPQYYRDTSLKDFRAPELGDFDLLNAVLPAAKKRGMKSICWFEDVFRNDTPGVQNLQEKDLHNQSRATLCFNNPEYRNWLLGTVEDYARSHPIHGIMWGSERQGAFSNALGAKHGGRSSDPGRVTCFCRFCQSKGKRRGIDFDRVRLAYLALEQFVRDARAHKRPVDGYFVTLQRLTLKYPELLAWEMLWTDSLRDTYRAMYQKVKSVNANIGMGWHIWHNNSFNPIYRAEQDLEELSKYSDFLKVVMYHNCGGERMVSYIDSVSETIYGDVPKGELLEFHYRVLNYDESPYKQLAKTRFSADYVYRETVRARAGLKGTKTLLWPGIDIDIPTAPSSSKSTPEGTRDAVLAAIRGGADGVLLSRKYSEMRLANLSGAGAALKQAGSA